MLARICVFGAVYKCSIGGIAVSSRCKLIARVSVTLFASMTECSGGTTSFLRSLPLETADLPSRSYDHLPQHPGSGGVTLTILDRSNW